jgi:putative pyruvate formate lyase activating enzyme
MPGSVSDSKAVLGYLYNTYHDRIYISIMSQYTPMPSMAADPLLCRTLSAGEYEEVVDYCISLGMENAFIQDGTTASESFIPSFDYEGL